MCIFMFGGNDCNNLLIPNDKARYPAYQTMRQNLAIAQGSLIGYSLIGERSDLWLAPQSLAAQPALYR